MSGTLETFVGKSVMIVSCDGRCFSGTLKGNIKPKFDFLLEIINLFYFIFKRIFQIEI